MVTNGEISSELLVRSGPEASAPIVRSLRCGEVFCSSERRLDAEGRLRLKVSDGWVCASAEPGATAQAESTDAPEGAGRGWYRVDDVEGLRVRRGLELNTASVCVLPFGEIFEAVERRQNQQGQLRLRIEIPGDDKAAWASERAVGQQGEPGTLLVTLLSAPPEGGYQRAHEYRVVSPSSLVVRAGLEIKSPVVREIPSGEVFEALSRRINLDQIGRLQVSDGWVSEREKGPKGRALVEELDANADLSNAGAYEEHKGWHKIVDPEGLVVRQGCELTSAVLRTLPYGAMIEAVDRKTNTEGVVRLKMQGGGWVSEQVKPTASGAPGKVMVEAIEAPEMCRRLWYCVKTKSLVVRRGLELSTAEVESLRKDAVFEVTERKRNAEGQMRLFVEHLDGWASEWPKHAQGGDNMSNGEALCVQILPQIGEGIFWYRVLAAEGLIVRRSKEPPSAPESADERSLRTLKKGDTFVCTLRALCSDGSLALHVGDGWVSARRPPGYTAPTSSWPWGSNGKGSGCLLVEEIDAPISAGYFGYRVVDAEGLLVRTGVELSTPSVRRLTRGDVFLATARCTTKAQKKMRIFMGDGWASERVMSSGVGADELLVAPVDDAAADLAMKSTLKSWYRVICLSGAPIWPETNDGKDAPPSVSEELSGPAPRETLAYNTIVTVDHVHRSEESGRLWLRLGPGGGGVGSGGWTPHRAVQGEATGALLFQRVDAPEGMISGWYISLDSESLRVRKGIELPSEPVRNLPPRVPFFVTERRRNSSGIMRLFIGDGWVSERFTNADGSMGGLLASMTSAPKGEVACWYKVTSDAGLEVREQPSLTASVVRTLNCETAFYTVRSRVDGTNAIWLQVSPSAERGSWVRIAANLNASGGNPGEGTLGTAERVPQEEAPEAVGSFWYEATDALLVRQGLDLKSDPVRTIPSGAVFEAMERQKNAAGQMRLRVPGGWTSEKESKGNPPKVLVQHVVAPEGTGLFWYRVVASDSPFLNAFRPPARTTTN